MMKKDNIHLLVCRFYGSELKTILNEEEFSDIELSLCPWSCIHPSKNNSKHKDDVMAKNPIFLVGSCLKSQEPNINSNPQTNIFDNNFEMIAGKDLVQSYMGRGYYIITPGWLKNWRKRISEMGFNQQIGRMFFSESTLKLLLLDTGVDELAETNLKEFSEFINIPRETIHIGLSYLRMSIRHLQTDQNFKNHIEKSKKQSFDSNRIVADYSSGLDILRQLSKSLNTKEVIEEIINLFKMLFAPKVFAHLKQKNSGLIKCVSSFGELNREEIINYCKSIEKEWDYSQSKNGFILRLGNTKKNYEFLYLDQFTFPQYFNHYLNLAIQMNSLANLVIENVRNHEFIVSTRERNHKIKKLESLAILAGGIAHDFNNQLTVIKGNTTLALMDVPENSDLEESMLEIEDATERCINLASQMLAYSGKGQFTLHTFDLYKIVSDLRGNLNLQSITPVNVKILYKLKNHALIHGDKSQIIQILMSLITNSLEAIEKDKGIITISAGYCKYTTKTLKSYMPSTDLKEGDYAFIEVKDDGCGMNEEELNKIFDPFFTTKFQGRGLSLPALQGIVKGHNGAIAVSSERGKGTDFKIILPVIKKQEET
jgi:signal transduction histidine kinase